MRVYILASLFFIPFLAASQRIHSGPDTNAINAIYSAANAWMANDLDSAYQLTLTAYRLSQKANYRAGIAKAMQRFGAIHQFKGRNDSALIFFRQALALREELMDYKAQAGTCKTISYSFRALGNKDSSYFYLYKALALYSRQGDSVSIAGAYNELGELCQAYGDIKSALGHLDNALRIFSNYNDTASVSRVYSKYGIVYYYQRDYKKALDYFLRANALNTYLNNKADLATDLNYLGLCYDALKNDKLCVATYREAASLFRHLCLDKDRAEVLYNLGYFFLQREMADSSIYYLTRSNQLLKSLGEDALSLKVYQALASVYEKKGDYTKAYDYHVKYSNLNDSLLNSEKIRSIAEMQTRYETEKKEQQINLLDQQNKTRSAQRNFFIAGSIVLLLGLFVLGYYYVQRKRLALRNEQIAQEKIGSLLKEQEINTYNAMIEGQEEERKRIATDLHDRLGSMLSTVKLLFGSLTEKIDRNQEENEKREARVTGLLDEAVLEVRRISHNLSTGMVNTFGLVTALEELCESVDRSGIVRCRLLSYGMEGRLDPQVEIGLFRMVQELVNNALKHSKAKQLTIQINRTEESLNLTLEDDGVGFDVEAGKASGGMGLKSLQARAARLNGVYHVDSRPGRGTISIIEIPLKDHD
jgi:two-component system NarL family sensor kinase